MVVTIIVGGVIKMIPLTGITLPFISYGGSNYITNIGCIGLVINVAMRSRVGQAHTTELKRSPKQL